MYNVDDAIAKIDGYVISISGGGPFVGESKLIRIDEVKRTAAYASILSEQRRCPEPGRRATSEPTSRRRERRSRRPRQPPSEDAGRGRRRRAEDGERAKVQSNGSTGKRRRGRRGGRRRSRARAARAQAAEQPE